MVALSGLTLFALAAKVALALPHKRWGNGGWIGANYFQTNGFGGNQLVSSYIMADGTLSAGSAAWTYGNGSAGINDPSPYENHPDPFYGSGAVVVSGCQVFVVNAGSDTFSVFDIDPSDPGNPSYSASYPSNGEFPTSLAVSPDGQVVCVSNSGAQNGLSCYVAGNDGWTHDAQWDRSYGLNLTTPPHGPVGGTPSQIAFSSDGSSLLVVIKGQLPTDLNNPTNATQPGAILSYAIDNNGSLAAEPTMTPAALPFSISEDMSAPGVYFLTDVSTGYAVWDSTTPNSTVVQGTIANQAAVCWVAQSPRTGDFYTVDIGGKSNITEVSLDTQDLNGTVITHHGLGVNASGTDNSIFSGAQYDYMYVNAPAYNSVHTFEIQGPGQFSLVQRYGVGDMSGDVVPSGGFVGQAVWYAK